MYTIIFINTPKGVMNMIDTMPDNDIDRQILYMRADGWQNPSGGRHSSGLR